jgi:hypothetical protein
MGRIYVIGLLGVRPANVCGTGTPMHPALGRRLRNQGHHVISSTNNGSFRPLHGQSIAVPARH